MSTVTTSRNAVSTSNVGAVLYKWLWSGQYSIFPFIPKPVKYLALVLLLFNAKSWPFVWHVKLWWPAIWGHIQAKRKGLKPYYWNLGLFTTEDKKDPKVQKMIQSDPFKGEKFVDFSKVVSRKKCHAYYDDCDYNKHLSNSSYAKNLDYARMQACVEAFSPFFAPGGWMALGAGSYQYLKEIPMLSDYEIHLSVGGFEEKWLYLVAEFVSYPKRGASSRKSDKSTPPKPTSALQAESSDSKHPAVQSVMNDVLSGSITKRVAQQVRSDGSVLHCLAVSSYCFKIGRLTVPPRVVLSFCGYGDASNWDRAEKLITGSTDRGKKWLQGGWKDEAEEIGKEFAEHPLNVRGREAGAKLGEAFDGLRTTVDAALRDEA
ncbi:hypothetical protein NliqN6_2543 [Naganishia liquefaciens]|uniref:Uncharacterized protein n=1 Tax=Naganishia liquefaciens TaxID=104408 RepID=A0A8H3YFW5_9TREE|nr:hypothetical protein NliqN6_2543 [Naganishia liquefaciens]